MSKISKIALGLGVVAGMAASLLPLTAYADDDLMSASDELLVKVNVAPVISMRLESHYINAEGTAVTLTETCNSTEVVEADEENNVEYFDGCQGDAQEVHTVLSPGQADTSSMYTNIYVSTNSVGGYSLTLIDEDDNVNLVSDSSTIAAIASLPVGTSNPGWAIHVDGKTASGADVWEKMPKNKASDGAGTAETAITVKNYQPATPAAVKNDLSKVTYGVAATADQASGIYHDTVVYTATAL